MKNSILYMLCLACLLTACKEETEKTQVADKAKPSLAFLTDTSTTVIPPAIDTTNARQRIAALKKKFIYIKDEFSEDRSYYVHKTFGRYLPKRNTLILHVHDGGIKTFHSNYFGPYIGHRNIRVKIGDKIISKQPKEESRDGSIQVKEDPAGVGVYEHVQYYYDNGITDSVYFAKSDRVVVRFLGKEDSVDVVLPKADVQALKDSYELSELMYYATP